MVNITKLAFKVKASLIKAKTRTFSKRRLRTLKPSLTNRTIGSFGSLLKTANHHMKEIGSYGQKTVSERQGNIREKTLSAINRLIKRNEAAKKREQKLKQRIAKKIVAAAKKRTNAKKKAV